jgi:hypothetical protein
MRIFQGRVILSCEVRAFRSIARWILPSLYELKMLVKHHGSMATSAYDLETLPYSRDTRAPGEPISQAPCPTSRTDEQVDRELENMDTLANTKPWQHRGWTTNGSPLLERPSTNGVSVSLFQFLRRLRRKIHLHDIQR